MVDKERVNLTVHPDTKSEWDKAANESTEYSSLSDLIRQSVAHELSESPDNAGTPQTNPETGQVGTSAEAMDNVSDALVRIEDTLSDLDERVSEIEKEMSSTARTELKNQVFNTLPEEPDTMSPEEIAKEIGADRERVAHILRELEDTTSEVRVEASVDQQQFFTRSSDHGI